jgi:hypothetical protein
MAQERKVITSIGEATCENCIYSVVDEKEVWCRKEIGDDDTALAHWCGEGVWLAYMYRKEGMNVKPSPASLDKIFVVHGIEEKEK